MPVVDGLEGREDDLTVGGNDDNHLLVPALLLASIESTA